MISKLPSTDFVIIGCSKTVQLTNSATLKIGKLRDHPLNREGRASAATIPASRGPTPPHTGKVVSVMNYNIVGIIAIRRPGSRMLSKKKYEGMSIKGIFQNILGFFVTLSSFDVK
ncbi:hypothetical protein I7I50_12119 [Histoplasma capsulatum G186AR]|uniref:Uncharacterized protein n=1 Tax=Ajellomyces capsulatus TaxID=5037 RepID=A0A8H7Y8C8_AJECA|nr:hypothetical protein I7I52_11569 [Histoplasma capsulatum]QSS70477.1 hypothetical protein I7I50_12119 [Histoplasma capsulatum G186AR]